jgi:hypothetical protein
VIWMILSRKYGIALIMAIIIFIPNVYAIKVSVSNGDRTSYSGDYRLDKSTSLRDNILLASEGIFQERQASGSGNNAIVQSIGGDDYSGKSSLITSGSFSSSSFSVVRGNAGTISQDTYAEGDAKLGLSATTASGTAIQQAEVQDGVIQSSQNSILEVDAFAAQKTAISGETGSIASISEGENDPVVVDGDFSGDGGNLNANLASISSSNSDIYGDLSIMGVECLNRNVLADISSGQVGINLNGLYEAQDKNLGTFNFRAEKQNAYKGTPSGGKSKGSYGTPTDANQEIIKPAPGDANSYVLLNNRMISPENPVQLYLKTDSFLLNEKLKESSANQAISKAAATWDYWTEPYKNNLFRSVVINDPYKAADMQDGFSVHAFMPFSISGFIAYSRTYCDNSVTVLESDVTYNSNYAWTTDYLAAKKSGNRLIDLQSVALHELGHTCGLGDLYNLPNGDSRKADSNEIMNSYDSPQHYLGAGDINGIRKKYGT